MIRTAALTGLVALALAPTPAPSTTQSGRVSLEAADCSRINQTFGDAEVARAEQYTSVPLGAPLELRPDMNGGVKIERGSGSAYRITACIAAGGRTTAEAQAAVDAVRLVTEGNRVRLTGAPDSSSRVRSWSVQLIVLAPDGASVEAETMNGPIGVTGANGSFSLRASNGPISLNEVGGDVKAHASNGPISVHGSRGEFDLETANGPISVDLGGSRWDGHLTARAANGPLTLTVPSDFQSGLEVSSSYQSPWNCRASVCGQGNRDSDERSRSLRIGSDPVVVRLSTVHGPVTIRER
jgi:hypothetical protein